MVEDVEESILCPCSCHPFLYIIYNEHVDGLVEGYEVILLTLVGGVGKLQLEGPGADVEYSLLGVYLLAVVAYGIHEVGLAAS